MSAEPKAGPAASGEHDMEHLVTGGAGFIGSNIVRRLVATGFRPRVLDDLSTGRMENIKDILGRIDFVKGDVTDPDTVGRAVKGVKFVFHLAAIPSVPRSVQDPVGTNRANVDGTLRLLVAARDAGVERFVFSSSSSVYGDTPELPKREGATPAPLSPYAVQKLAGEHYCRIFHGLYGLKTYALRYFNVFGPRQDPASQYAAVVPNFIAALARGAAPTIYGDGAQTRDFTYVEDVVEANLLCCKAPDAAAGGVYNVAGGRRTSVKELALMLARIMRRDIQPVHAAPRAGDVRDSEGDGSRAARALGWRPRCSLEEGLALTVGYFTSGAA
jgi:UDP-glucose 4-epimerase